MICLSRTIKKIFFIFFLCGNSWATSYENAGLELVGENSDIRLYLDLTSIKSKDDNVVFKLLTDFKNPENFGNYEFGTIASTEISIIGNCNLDEIKYVSGISYSEPMGEGNSEPARNVTFRKNWFPVYKTLFDQPLKYACLLIGLGYPTYIEEWLLAVEDKTNDDNYFILNTTKYDPELSTHIPSLKGKSKERYKTVWWLIDYKVPLLYNESEEAYSVIQRNFIDCEKNEIKIDREKYYYENFGKGQVVKTKPPLDIWLGEDVIKEGSAFDAMIYESCHLEVFLEAWNLMLEQEIETDLE